MQWQFLGAKLLLNSTQALLSTLAFKAKWYRIILGYMAIHLCLLIRLFTLQFQESLPYRTLLLRGHPAHMCSLLFSLLCLFNSWKDTKTPWCQHLDMLSDQWSCCGVKLYCLVEVCWRTITLRDGSIKTLQRRDKEDYHITVAIAFTIYSWVPDMDTICLSKDWPPDWP